MNASRASMEEPVTDKLVATSATVHKAGAALTVTSVSFRLLLGTLLRIRLSNDRSVSNVE